MGMSMTNAPTDPDKPGASGVSTDLLQVRHRTSYRYAKPVTFAAHRGMFRPHESNNLRLVGIDISTQPESAQHWVHDVFSNAITVLEFTKPSDRLDVTCVFSVVRSTVHEPAFHVADFAKIYPFEYPEEQQIDLAALMRPEYGHPGEDVKSWARTFPAEVGHDTWAILGAINTAIHREFDYQRREEPGVQTPRRTLSLGAGSCRDFAVLMLEAVRQLGFAARFVTGYLYDPFTDGNGGQTMSGSGATHAWVQIFLPGAGWVEFDPTNGLIASGNLIRTGVVRTPSQAAPLRGSFTGDAADFLGLDVDVEVTALAPTLYG